MTNRFVSAQVVFHIPPALTGKFARKKTTRTAIKTVNDPTTMKKRGSRTDGFRIVNMPTNGTPGTKKRTALIARERDSGSVRSGNDG
jgi:hypothetical protein